MTIPYNGAGAYGRQPSDVQLINIAQTFKPKAELTIVPPPGAYVFVTSTPMPNAWVRFWQWFFLGWTWKEL